MIVPKFLTKGKSEYFVLRTLKEQGAITIRSMMEHVEIAYGTIQQICAKLQKENKIFVSGYEGSGVGRMKVFELGEGVDAVYVGDGVATKYAAIAEIVYNPIGTGWIPQRTEAELQEVQSNYNAFLNRRFA
jgi:hypothetical protein